MASALHLEEASSEDLKRQLRRILESTLQKSLPDYTTETLHLLVTRIVSKLEVQHWGNGTSG